MMPRPLFLLLLLLLLKMTQSSETLKRRKAV